MGTRIQGGRVRCAIAAGTLAAAVAGGSIFAGGAAVADDHVGLGGTVGTTVGGVVSTTGTPLIGTGGTSGSVLTLPPVTASVPVTVSTGNVLSSSSGPRSSSTSTTTNSPTTSTSTTSSNPSSTNSSSNSSSNTSSTGGATTTTTTTGSGNSSTGATTTTGSTSTSSNTSSTTNNSASNSNSNSNSNSSSADTTTNTTSTTSNTLNQVHLARSASAVYPSKDGYGDDITFDVRPLDAQGRPVAVTGKAYLVADGRIVRTWNIDGSTSKIVWDGLVDGKILPGTYSFVLDVRSATGVSAQTTSSFSVSGKKLVKRTVTVKRAASALKKGVALPAVVSKNLKYGPVTVKASVAKKLRTSVQVNIVRAGADRKVVIKKGKRTSGTATLPAASKAVKVVLAKKSRGVKTGKITVTYRYTKLG